MKKFWISILIFTTMHSTGQITEARAIPLENQEDLSPLISAASDKSLVLLGEASHGTHEYYYWRDAISRQLIENHNFNFIAVEGDFASLYELNLYVKNKNPRVTSAKEAVMQLERWPRWMWANEEVVALAEWLKTYNSNLKEEEKVGFFGMDVYDEWESKRVVLEILKDVDVEIYNYVQQEYDCFHPYKGDSWGYARAVKRGRKSCKEATRNVVSFIRSKPDGLKKLSGDDYFYLLQNAIVVHNAESFYRESLASEDAVSWNARVFHMHETIKDLAALHGPKSKGIVWAHNTHIGDARYTNMKNFGEKNIGQLARETFGADAVFLIGFTSYEGEVMAAPQWGAKMQKMTIPKAISGSIEAEWNTYRYNSFYMIFDKKDRQEKKLSVTGNRAVGVVYNPKRDRHQFVPTIVPMRYDGLVFFKKTTALHVLKP